MLSKLINAGRALLAKLHVKPLSLSANTLAQMAHVGWGGLLVLSGATFGHPIAGVLFATAVCSFKEALFDPITEDLATKGSGWVDWIFWNLGIALAGVLVHLAHKL